ncbi:MAG TPA: hypothetical protein VK841_00855 [Polyangiaceae bacterium]|nr:hypothetical protein [Polyangiaceae bacterium]
MSGLVRKTSSWIAVLFVNLAPVAIRADPSPVATPPVEGFF